MQQKTKFIIFIALICFIFLLFLPVKVWSANNYSVGGGGSCLEVCARMEYEMVDYGYGPFWKYSCVEYYPLPPECYEDDTTTTTKKEERKWNCYVCSGPNCVIETFTSVCQHECKPRTAAADCGGTTVWYTYKRCSDGRCVNHSTTVGPSPDECRTHADCITGGGTTDDPDAWYWDLVASWGEDDTTSHTTSPPSNGAPSNGWTPPTSPPPPPKYSCNRSTWTCYQNSGGPYSSLSSCQSACVEPPCMINYFEFLQKRAWVGYPITGTWSASDWCKDCDVTCTPYPECVWKQDSIGIGSDEYKFTLEQSGDYIYTLTCYKQGGADQKQAIITLEALNLPWWREIIPVLRGFLGGIFR